MDAPRQAARPRPSVNDPEGCETTSSRKGCIGGERVRNPNWSPTRIYFGGGGPADQKYEDDRAPLVAARARTEANVSNRLTNCNASGCWDGLGNRYNRTGDGSKLVGPDGRMCRHRGGNVQC